jgi:hypothetical protein
VLNHPSAGGADLLGLRIGVLSLILGDRGELTHFQLHARIWVSWALRRMARLDSQHLGREG